MLNRPRRALFFCALFFCAGIALVGCTEGIAEAPAVETTTTTITAPVDRETTLRIGIAVNNAAPTAQFDAAIETILQEAITILDAEDSLRIELATVSIETPGQAEGTVSALIQDGVSVVVTGCDDATVPSVVEAATSNELLAVTGCVALPRPDIARASNAIDPALFIDLSSLADNAIAMQQYSQDEGHETVGVIRSTLLPDVEQTCLDFESEIAASGNAPLDVVPGTTFAELIDAPSNVVADFAGVVEQTARGTVDAIVVCALPPTAGDVVQALREAGFDQQVIIPWYGDSQSWTANTTNVMVVTPASRHGDDPEARTADLFDALNVGDQQPDAVDVVTADTLAILVDAVRRSGSVGSRRVAETIRSSELPVAGVSGQLETSGSTIFPLRRVYRVISIENGEPEFATLASALENEVAAEE